MKFKFYSIMTLFLISSFSLQAYDDTPTCFKNVEDTFFDRKMVILALQLYQTDKSFTGQWDPFARELVSSNRLIRSRMEEYGKKMKPSPLEHPFDQKGSLDLLRTVAREIFMGLMLKYQPVESRNWDAIFQYIYNFEQARITDCK